MPIEISFCHKSLVSAGKPTAVRIPIYCDENSTSAPVHRNSNGRDLVVLRADLSHLTESELEPTIKRCADGQEYYSIKGFVEATFYSASTKYVLLSLGKRYDTVTAEYV